MTVLAHLPIVLSLLLLAAHYLRGGAVVVTGVLVGLCALLFVPRVWAARLLQVALILGCIEWLRTLVVLALQRQHAGLPWLRIALILGAVAALTAASAWLFQTRRVGSRFGTANR